MNTSLPCLDKIHWLSIKEDIIFKISVLVFKCLNAHAPLYLSNLKLSIHHPEVYYLQVKIY